MIDPAIAERNENIVAAGMRVDAHYTEGRFDRGAGHSVPGGIIVTFSYGSADRALSDNDLAIDRSLPGPVEQCR
jgi:hypothetical protein